MKLSYPDSDMFDQDRLHLTGQLQEDLAAFSTAFGLLNTSYSRIQNDIFAFELEYDFCPHLAFDNFDRLVPKICEFKARFRTFLRAAKTLSSRFQYDLDSFTDATDLARAESPSSDISSHEPSVITTVTTDMAPLLVD